MTRVFYEFFAGGGMARAGLGPGWRCAFANDFDPRKAESYRANWPAEMLLVGDIANVHAGQHLPTQADMAWASFPCQDLSLAGDYAGLKGKRSGTFWHFWDLVLQLSREQRPPRLIVLENVYGALTSHEGRDFDSIAQAFSAAGYQFGAMVVDARLFVPQSRPRLFIVGVHGSMVIPEALKASAPQLPWHPRAITSAHGRLGNAPKSNWVWWSMPLPTPRKFAFVDLIEPHPEGVDWHSPAETARLLEMMSPRNREKVDAAVAATRQGGRIVGGVYRRTREGQQRAEVRFDDVAGCLRTPAGGSSRQTVLVIEAGRIRSRLVSPREAARLMGLPDSYVLPSRLNQALHLTGDGVVVPAVRHISRFLLEPLLSANDHFTEQPVAAE